MPSNDQNDEPQSQAPGLPSPEVARFIRKHAGKGHQLVRAVTGTGALMIGIRLADGRAFVFDDVDPERDASMVEWCWQQCAAWVSRQFSARR